MTTPHRSFWLEEALRDPPIGASEGPLSAECDIAILGGGYVGLWTAIRILEQAPGTRVVVLERDICGGGASGRNGGFALSWWPKVSSLSALLGSSVAIEVARESEAAIGELGAFCADHQIRAEFRRAPWIWTATSRAQHGAWEGVTRFCESRGLDVFRRLEPAEVARRTGSAVHRSGVEDRSAALVHPARLARGLARVAIEMGAKIFERAEVLTFSRAEPSVLQVRRETGEVSELRARRVVIATNAWAASIPELSRAIVPITSDMVMTAPARKELEEVGWSGGDCITDSQMMVDYYQVTPEGRVAFGKGGWGIAYGGRLTSDFDRNPVRARAVEADLRRTYPKLKNIPVTHDWSGPIDRTPNSLPLLGALRRAPNIMYGVGWSGNGVGPSLIGGRVLASLALGLRDRWSEYPLVGRSVGTFPPEPIRYWGAHFVRSAVVVKERAEILDRDPPFWSVQIAKLAPKGLEDKE